MDNETDLNKKADYIMNQFPNYLSIVCLNGDLPDVNFFNNHTHIPIYAVDGGANKILKYDIKPTRILGDLDSLDLSLYTNFYRSNSLNDSDLIHALPDQERCDFEKTIDFLGGHHLLPTLITGCNGGSLDQIFKNCIIFFTYHLDMIGSFLYVPPILGFLLPLGEHVLKLPLGTKLSIFGHISTYITTNGLKWDMDTCHLSLLGYNSISNETITETIQIQVLSSVTFVMIYL